MRSCTESCSKASEPSGSSAIWADDCNRCGRAGKSFSARGDQLASDTRALRHRRPAGARAARHRRQGSVAGRGRKPHRPYRPSHGLANHASRMSYNERGRGPALLWQAVRYLVSRRGILNMPSAPVLGFVRTRPELDTPDVQFHFSPWTFSSPKVRKLDRDPGLTATVYQLRPLSRGSVPSAVARSRDRPEIPIQLSRRSRDRRTTVDGMRFARRIVRAAPMRELLGAELRPGDDARTDDELLDYARRKAETGYHPAGTCRMGRIRWRSSTPSSGCAASRHCGWWMPRSCRR